MDIMIDLETLDTSSDSVILTIGAIKFNRNLKKIDKIINCNTFYRRINIASCLKVGLSISKETEKFWNNQTKEVRYEAIDCKDRIGLYEALTEFSNWVGRSSAKIWCQGNNFDSVILANAYKACNLKIPWHFWNSRDTRTIFDITKISLRDFERDHPLHHALYDAYHQVKVLKEALSRLSMGTTIN